MVVMIRFDDEIKKYDKSGASPISVRLRSLSVVRQMSSWLAVSAGRSYQQYDNRYQNNGNYDRNNRAAPQQGYDDSRNKNGRQYNGVHHQSNILRKSVRSRSLGVCRGSRHGVIGTAERMHLAHTPFIRCIFTLALQTVCVNLFSHRTGDFVNLSIRCTESVFRIYGKCIQRVSRLENSGRLSVCLLPKTVSASGQ